MPVAEPSRCRLCLVTPPGADIATFPELLGDALSGGDVASLIVTAPAGAALQDFAAALVPLAQPRGVAVLIHNETQIAGRVRADGVHVDTSPADLAAAVAAFRGKRIVGAGNLRSRHDAMTAGEAQPDYVFFGRLDGDHEDGIHARALELAAWWSELFVIPAVVMGGSTVASVVEAADAGVDFVALSRAVFGHRDPAAAVAEANALLARAPEPAA
ncbi:MAG TPA: thiamine phosphate synthase [Bauldia sp.]|nr:thiamine phosphate synthase [Bauldia sp.]